jgi:hypothetical protein
VILAPWIAVGAAELMRRARANGGAPLAAAAALAVALPAGASWDAHRAECDLSRIRFAEDFARNLLEPLPPRAILLTNGDNDSFPLWYMQQAENVRPDVTVLNLPLLNTGFYVAKLRRDDPELAQVLEGEPDEGVLAPRQLPDSMVTTVVEPRTGLGLPPGEAAPESVTFHVSGMLFATDRAVLDILRLTRWRRPVYLACTVAPGQLEWLMPFARYDGLAQRVIPSDDPAVWDVDHFRDQMLNRVSYEGIADPTLRMDADSRALCRNYPAVLYLLASAQLERGQPREALTTLRALNERTPYARLGETSDPFAELRAQIEAAIADENAGR